MPFTPGFDPAEALVLIAISAALEGDNPAPAIPANWQLDFDSPELGPFENKYQIWKNTDVSGQYALVIRGTVDKRGSILEDLLSVMIPASGTLPLGSVQLSYTLAAEPNAGIHLGFTLGLGFLLFDGFSGIVAQLYARLGQIQELFVAGHSQGAAVATLCRSFFQYSPVAKPLGLTYKTYVFAQPKPGNDYYAYDFETVAGNGTLAFQVTNSLDWVPQVPLTLEWLDDLNVNPLSVRGGSGDPVVADLANARARLRADATARQLVRVAPHLGALGAVLAAQSIQPVEKTATTAQTKLHILPTLYFFNAGARIMLVGSPCPTPDCDGGWYQHHATTYYDLIQAQYG
jgi:Lipase (class 3)